MFLEEANFLEKALSKCLPYIISIIDIIGSVIIVTGIVLAIVWFFTTKNERIVLGKTINLGLEFILCGEVLRSIIVRSMDELKILAMVVFIRTVIAVLTHWELKNELVETGLTDSGSPFDRMKSLVSNKPRKKVSENKSSEN